MNAICEKHPDDPVAACCGTCEKALCVACVTEHRGVIFCSPQCQETYEEVQAWLDGGPEISTDSMPAQKASPPPAPKPAPAEPKKQPVVSRPANPCKRHPEAFSVGTCARCGAAFCDACAARAPYGSFCSVGCLDETRKRELATTPLYRRPAAMAAAGALVAVVAVVWVWAAASSSSSKPEDTAAAPAGFPDANVTEPPPLPPAVPETPPKVEPKPVQVPEPPKAEPPKPDPPKPEPPKPEPPKPKPEPPKQEPPKPDSKPPPPPPPPPKPDPPKPDPGEKAKEDLARAATLLREATPLYREFAERVEKPPDDKPALEAALRKADVVRQKLTEARSLFERAKDHAPDRRSIDNRITQISDLLAVLAKGVGVLRERMK